MVTNYIYIYKLELERNIYLFLMTLELIFFSALIK